MNFSWHELEFRCWQLSGRLFTNCGVDRDPREIIDALILSNDGHATSAFHAAGCFLDGGIPLGRLLESLSKLG